MRRQVSLGEFRSGGVYIRPSIPRCADGEIAP